MSHLSNLNDYILFINSIKLCALLSFVFIVNYIFMIISIASYSDGVSVQCSVYNSVQIRDNKYTGKEFELL